MKPVIKKQTIYSLLLMRDDCGVRRFRVRAFWLKFLFCFLLLFCAAFGVSGYLAHSYWKKYAELQEEHRDLQRQYAEIRRRLEPLAYLEKMRELGQSRFSVEASGANGVAGANATISAVVPFPRANQTLAAGSAASPSGNGAPGAGPAAATPAAGPARNQTQPVPSAQAAAQTPEAAAQIDPAHPAKIANVSLRAAGTTRIRIAFDLSNQDPQQTLGGRVALAVVTNAGAVAEITQVDRAELSFLIARYKRISTTFALPQNIQTTDVAAVQISLSGDNVPPYSERFPMQ